MSIVDYIPVIGHIKGAVQAARGDEDGAEKTMVRATGSTVVATGAMTGGPVGAVGVGATFDIVIGESSKGKHTNGVYHVVKNPTEPLAYVEAGLNVAVDAGTGMLSN